MVNPTTSPLIFSKLLYNIYLPLPIFLPPTNKNCLVIFLNPSPPELRSFGLSPIFPYGNTGEKIEYFLSYRQKSHNKRVSPSPPCRLPQHCGALQNNIRKKAALQSSCLLYTSPSPRDRTRSRMPSSA